MLAAPPRRCWPRCRAAPPLPRPPAALSLDIRGFSFGLLEFYKLIPTIKKLEQEATERTENRSRLLLCFLCCLLFLFSSFQLYAVARTLAIVLWRHCLGGAQMQSTG